MEILWDTLAGVLIAALSGMGIGSGGLLVLYLTLLRGTPQQAAQGANLLFFIFSAGSAISIHLARRKIRFFMVLVLIVGGIPGVLAGTRLALWLPGDWMRKIFGAFLILASLAALRAAVRPEVGSMSESEKER